MGVYNFNLWKYVAQCLPFTAPMAANFICFLIFLLIKKKACSFWKCVILSLFCVLLIFSAGLVKSSGKRIETEVKCREDKSSVPWSVCYILRLCFGRCFKYISVGCLVFHECCSCMRFKLFNTGRWGQSLDIRFLAVFSLCGVWIW